MGQTAAKKYDLVIVGAGFFGAVCAYELTRKGFRCLMIEKRKHIGGNCYTEARDGNNIHQYGAHAFHTSSRKIWEWINQFATFNNYCHRQRANYEGRIFSFPINLKTFQQLWGVQTTAAAQAHLDKVRLRSDGVDSLEDWALSHLGRELYEMFIKGYTEKQWGRAAADLPSSIIRRLPIRFTEDDRYFDDTYQGIPTGGYTPIFGKLLEGIDVRLDSDYFASRTYFDSLGRRLLYTGPIDHFFDYRFGRLDYRGLRFELERLECEDYQGIAVMTYTSSKDRHTRIVEHKHLEFGRQPVTWITREYPQAALGTQEPFYPIRDQRNQRIFEQYKEWSGRLRQYYLGGRLAEYQYYDMHQVIGSALKKCEDIERDLRK
jgi:UDP-galactopyranose mutase